MTEKRCGQDIFLRTVEFFCIFPQILVLHGEFVTQIIFALDSFYSEAAARHVYFHDRDALTRFIDAIRHAIGQITLKTS